MTTMYAPPTLIYGMLGDPTAGERDYGSLRHLIYSAAPMRADQIREAQRVFGPVVETAYGFHLMRVDSRQPGEVKVRHILIIPQTDSTDLARARAEADSVATAWRSGASYDELTKRHYDPAEQSLVSDFPLALEKLRHPPFPTLGKRLETKKKME